MKTSDFLSFALIISSDESQSKAQSLGGNKIVYRAENINFFHRWKLEDLFLYPPNIVLLCKAIIYNCHVMLLLVNVMFPNFANNLVNIDSKPNGF